MILALLLLAQTIPPPPPGFVLVTPRAVRLGPGPHTLVIATGQHVTRMDYKTGAACQRAKEAVLAQMGARQNADGSITVASANAFCVPR